ADDGELIHDAGADEFRAVDPIAHQSDHVGPRGAKAFGQPTADEPGRSCHQRRATAPEGGVYSQTFHAAAPLLLRPVSAIASGSFLAMLWMCSFLRLPDVECPDV